MTGAQSQRWLAYLELLRLPNVFTALADVSMGYLLATAGHVSWRVLAPLLASSACLYTGGIVLNDVCDYAQDLLERPQRPLPSGRIGRNRALSLAMLLLGAGVLAGWTASWFAARWHCGLIATTLAGCVLLYDVRGKKTTAGPLLMGTCRFLNVLLGMGAASRLTTLWPWPTAWLCVAAGIGVYVAGITWFARHEAGVSHRFSLGGGIAVMAAGIGLLMLFPTLNVPGGAGEIRLTDPWVWPALLLLLTAPVLRRSLSAIVEPTPARIQAAVKPSIRTLILLDAAICLAAVGPGPALAVLSLLIPFLALGRWVYST
jgi:4-hydroxybenzoate polyprenyltransferase